MNPPAACSTITKPCFASARENKTDARCSSVISGARLVFRSSRYAMRDRSFAATEARCVGSCRSEIGIGWMDLGAKAVEVWLTAAGEE